MVSSSGEHSLTLNPMGNTFKDLPRTDKRTTDAKTVYWGNKIICYGNKLIFWGNNIHALLLHKGDMKMTSIMEICLQLMETWQFLKLAHISSFFYSMAKRKRTNNDLQNITQKTKDQATRTPLKTWCDLRCSETVCSSCSTCDTRRVTLFINRMQVKVELLCTASTSFDYATSW
jgi:hypothetical protein